MRIACVVCENVFDDVLELINLLDFFYIVDFNSNVLLLNDLTFVVFYGIDISYIYDATLNFITNVERKFVGRELLLLTKIWTKLNFQLIL